MFAGRRLVLNRQETVGRAVVSEGFNSSSPTRGGSVSKEGEDSLPVCSIHLCEILGIVSHLLMGVGVLMAMAMVVVVRHTGNSVIQEQEQVEK